MLSERLWPKNVLHIVLYYAVSNRLEQLTIYEGTHRKINLSLAEYTKLKF